MYSVLIPIYNVDVSKLVRELHRQATELMLDFEIILLEDGSDTYTNENSGLSVLQGCRYFRLEANIGRSAARNRLADFARYPYLIFMDCDAEVQHDDYLQRYANFFRDENVVVVGGTAYDTLMNAPRYSLRLKYGRKREANDLYHHRENSFNNFATFNFLISKSVFNTIRFDEGIEGYGHEDTLFGHALHVAGFSFFRIDNALIHNGLDDNHTFLSKTEESVSNLYRLFSSGRYDFLVRESRLLSTFVELKNKKLVNHLAYAGKFLKPFLRWQLCSKYPSLRLYDVYKLICLCQIAEAN
jgi:glycosyltransferase involved in cell wall biosynthesis